jgi:hypothetical protein
MRFHQFVSRPQPKRRVTAFDALTSLASLRVPRRRKAVFFKKAVISADDKKCRHCDEDSDE